MMLEEVIYAIEGRTLLSWPSRQAIELENGVVPAETFNGEVVSSMSPRAKMGSAVITVDTFYGIRGLIRDIGNRE